MLSLVLFVIALAILFDFLNGFHDAANSIATIVSTRVLTPRKAVAWAAFFNLVAALVFDVRIAKTVGEGLVSIAVINEYVIMAGLLGAITWNLITWYYGIPSSSSHALIGGYCGAGLAKAGFGAIIWSGWIKTLVFIAVAPLMGMVLGYFLQVLVIWIVHRRRYSKVNLVFRKLQLLSAALYSLGHGTNDAQKTMGSKITKLKPSDGFCAETAGGITLLVTAFSGIAVSTTHTIAGAIMGVGATKRLSAVRWGVAGTMVWAWILTLPASALVAALAYYIIEGVKGLVG